MLGSRLLLVHAAQFNLSPGMPPPCPSPSPALPLPLLPSRAPSLQAFDELLLLKRGGRTIFHGPIGRRAADLVSYFEAVPGMKGVGNLKWRYSSRCQGAGDTARA